MLGVLRIRWAGPAVALGGLVAVLGAGSPARACGGLFCDGAAPVNQAAERIIFSHNGDGSVTAVVQILYQGPADRFSWVLPVPGTPEVGVSSNDVFTALQARTNPVYQLNTRVEGDCRRGGGGGGGVTSGCSGGGSLFDPPAAVDGPGDGMGITVVDMGMVGPYDYETIAFDPDLPSPGDAAVDWLEANGYEVGDLGAETLGSYLAAGMNLIAFRLTPDGTRGTIRPIVLTYAADHPMIPIRPTAVAANDDMGILVWILGDARAVPTNYRSLVLDQALVNWLAPGTTYGAVVTQAADAAGGQGFVTELAGPTEDVAPVVYDPESMALPDRDELEAMEPTEAYLLLSGRYFWTDGFIDAFGDAFPEDVGCLTCPEEEASTDEILAFVEALQEHVVGPLESAQALLDSRPYVTRLFTTMSAGEMTVDPEFDLNPDLGDVSNVHTATRILECRPGLFQWEAPFRVEIEGYPTVRSDGPVWPFTPGAADAPPANLRVEQAATFGPNEIVRDNTLAVGSRLSDHADAMPPSDIRSRDGCALDDDGYRTPAERLGGQLGCMLVAVAALAWRRRRRFLARGQRDPG